MLAHLYNNIMYRILIIVYVWIQLFKIIMPNDDIRYLNLKFSRCLRSLMHVTSTITTYLQGKINIMYGMVNDISEKIFQFPIPEITYTLYTKSIVRFFYVQKKKKWLLKLKLQWYITGFIKYDFCRHYNI